MSEALDNKANAEVAPRTARDDLAEAYEKLEKRTAEPEKEQPEGSAPEAEEYQENEKPPEEKPVEAQPKEGRGADGKFAKADPKKREITPAPMGWKGDAKVEWNRLPKHVREGINEDYARFNEATQRLQAFDQVLTPQRRQQLQMAYGNEVQGLNQILATVEYSNSNPLDFIKWYANSRGIDLSRLVASPQQGQETAYVDPALGELQSQVKGLQQLLLTQQQQQVTNWQSQRANELNTFLADSVNHPYANDVFDDMMALISTKRASDLKDAYDKAVYANPSTRAKVLAAAQQNQLQGHAQQAAMKKSAAVSIAGAPGGKADFQEGIPMVNGRPETPTETLRRLMNNGEFSRV